MQRISINLDTRQMERLAYHSERTGAPQAEIVRRGLNAQLDRLDEEEFHQSQAKYQTSPPPTAAR